jgi:two-component system sensor histidine kinase RegB
MPVRNESIPGNTSEPSPDARTEIGLDWLIRLRWGASLGQFVTITLAQWMFGHLPLQRLYGLVLLLVVSNIGLKALRNRVRAPRLLCGAALTLDTLLLTGLLDAAGGPYNPFSVIYLVQITLSAVVLGPRWTWFLTALSVACYGLLFTSPAPLAGMENDLHLNIHLKGMWVALALAASLTAYFVVQLSKARDEREAEISVMRERIARHERLSSVATLAAGAAHELGTPLATIAVVSKELERLIRQLPEPYAATLMEDAGLIRSELERCRSILNQLAATAGQTGGEAPVEVTMEQLIDDVLGTVPEQDRSRITVSAEPRGAHVVRIPRNAVLQLTHNLIENALEASDKTVDIEVNVEASRMRIVVRDRGPGMSDEVMRRVGEPFFSTKPVGSGLGLGVFIARSLSEQMGGRLDLESRPGRGTSAVVEIEASRSLRKAEEVVE